MLKYVIYALLAVITIIIIAGGIHLWRVAQKNKQEMSRYQGAPVTVKQSFGKTLVIYYSLSGHTKEIAEKIRTLTNADIYEIKTAEKIDTVPWFYLKIKQQLKTGNFPRLAGDLPDFSSYDLIFFGAPVWWYTIATPAQSFLKQADFKNKEVAPFSTQGSNCGTFTSDFGKLAQKTRILPFAAFNNLPEKYNAAVDNKIATWLNSLPASKK